MEFDPSAVFADPGPNDSPTPDQGTPPTPGTPEHAGTPPVGAPETYDVPGVGAISRDELIKGYLRTQDYTRKTMNLSSQQRETETLRQQAAAMEQTLMQARALLSDRAKLQQYLASLPGGEPELPADQVLTTAEVQSLLKRARGETEASFEGRLRATEERIVTQAYQTQFEQTIDNHLRSIGDKHPELRSVPGMEVLLRQAVSSQKPGSIDDALRLFDQAATFYSERLRGIAKTVVAPPNNPLTRGIEPPNGGGAPAPGQVPEQFSGVKDPNLRSLVMQDVERALASGGRM